MIAALLAIAASVLAAWWSLVPAVSQTTNGGQNEIEIHRRLGATVVGNPAVADPNTSGLLKLKVIDADSKQPVFCRVNVVGADGNYYEPADNPLAPWSLHRLGNRNDKGPFRYYGWFFYCDGQCDVDVPAGATHIEVWKGFEYAPVQQTAQIAAGKTVETTVTIRRTIDMATRGWYSGDTHIHLDRRDETDNARGLDLAACEDIRFAHILCMNDPRRYQPLMDQQIWFQNFGLGPKSERYRGLYGIASGQEYRCGTFGHICFVNGSRLVDADGLKTDPNNWPVFGLVADELRSIGGYSFHAHGGYEREIYADFAQRATDGVELLQFAVYRGIALEGWYHILNAGFRFPAVGASDYPYCRALGDCRTYVSLDKAKPTFADWDRAAAEGRSFFTTGPLLEATVNGQRPGETVALATGEHTLKIAVDVVSPTAAIDEVHVIEAGQVRAKRKLPSDRRLGPFHWDVELPVNRSTWVAVRAFAKSGSGREDVEAHTNPVYVILDGRPPFDRNSVMWLLGKLDERIAFHANRKFDEREKVLAYFQKSRQQLLDLLSTGR